MRGLDDRSMRGTDDCSMRGMDDRSMRGMDDRSMRGLDDNSVSWGRTQCQLWRLISPKPLTRSVGRRHRQ